MDWGLVFDKMRAGVSSPEESIQYQQINEFRFIQVYTWGTEELVTSDEQGRKFAYSSVWDHAFFSGDECRDVTLKAQET